MGKEKQLAVALDGSGSLVEEKHNSFYRWAIVNGRHDLPQEWDALNAEKGKQPFLTLRA